MFLSAIPLLLLPHFAVSGAELFTVDSWRYGKFEARVRFAPSDGVVSSFFLWKPDSEMEDVYWNEVDIEKVGLCEYATNVFWGIPESQTPQKIETGRDVCGEWHTHTIEWTPESIVWRLDGEELRRIEGEIAAGFEANAPEGMQIRFNLWVGTPDFGGIWSDESLPDYQYIHWVTYSAYTPGAGDENSDFTFEWREDFDGDQLPAAWATGSWESPLGQSQHAPENVVFRDGVAILALTADDALGFEGTPPADSDTSPDDSSTGDASTGDTSTGDTSTGDASTGDTSTGTASTGTSSTGDASEGVTAGATTGGDDTGAEPTSTGGAAEDEGASSSDLPADAESSGDATEDSSEAGGDGCSCQATDSRQPPLLSLLTWVGIAAFGRRRWSLSRRA